MIYLLFSWKFHEFLELQCQILQHHHRVAEQRFISYRYHHRVKEQRFISYHHRVEEQRFISYHHRVEEQRFLTRENLHLKCLDHWHCNYLIYNYIPKCSEANGSELLENISENPYLDFSGSSRKPWTVVLVTEYNKWTIDCWLSACLHNNCLQMVNDKFNDKFIISGFHMLPIIDKHIKPDWPIWKHVYQINIVYCLTALIK